ncbi:Elongin-C [Astathelohania contejeani]|uniref:Elongin-C n=1 Tax=Astathelohania contejeani TaxID=164912 RepID=A0ABQ7I1B5_9MICR|nr:Elongin-C [Thelohania contejeani]
MDSQTPKVRLISSDHQEFFIDEEIANYSRTLKTFFCRDNPFIETQTRTMFLPMDARILKRVIEFLNYKHAYNNDAVNAPEFPIEDEEAVDLLDASAYLGI